MPIELLEPNPNNPRRAFPDAELDELANSIRVAWHLAADLVRPIPGGNYEIVAGERRWRAAQRAGLHTIPAVVRPINEREVLEIAIVENVQRTDLNPIEEASAYQRLADEFGYSQDLVAKTVGKSRPPCRKHVAAPQAEQPGAGVGHGRAASAGHARILVGLANQEELAKQIIERGYNVRQVEAIAQERAGGRGRSPRTSRRGKDADTVAFEKRLSDVLGLQVSLDARGDGGVLHIRLQEREQLEAVARKLER